MKGLTLIEIIVAIAVILIIVVFSFISLSSFRKNQSLKNAADEIVSLINQARSQTLSSQEFSQYGVHFETSRVVLFKGTVFSEPNPENIDLATPSLIEISDISLNGGGADLIFQRLTGKTDEFGIVVLRVKNDIGKTKTIEVKNTGIIDVR